MFRDSTRRRSPMGEELPKDRCDPSGPRKIPSEAREASETTDARARRIRCRRLCLFTIPGAAVGLTLAVSAAPGWFRLPEQCLGFVIGVTPGLPDWVLDWVC